MSGYGSELISGLANCNNVSFYRFNPKKVQIAFKPEGQQVKNSTRGTSYDVAKNLRLQGTIVSYAFTELGEKSPSSSHGPGPTGK